jgi:hypothetical protein
MKTLNSFPASCCRRSVAGLSSILGQSHFPPLLLGALCVLFGLREARGQVWLQGTSSGNYNYGAQCDTACPFTLSFATASNTYPVSPWSITLTDGNTTTPHSVSASSLQHNSGSPLATIVTGANALPTLDLTGLDPGTGTLVVTYPNNSTTTIPFNIINCVSGTALLLNQTGHSQVAPNQAGSYFVNLINVGPNPSTPVILEVTGILPTSDCTVTPVSGGMTVVDLGTSQKVSISVGAIAPGVQQTFSFHMQATPSAVLGTIFALNAAFTSTYPYTHSRNIQVVASLDPNGKYGPLGYGSNHSIPSNSVLPCLISFENDPSALAPAQIVTVTDYLDTSKVEPLSFIFGPVYFGNQVVVPPAGNPFSVTVPYDVDGNPLTTVDNIYVRITGSVSQSQFAFDYGKVVWTFESLDAPNGNPPPFFVGFLPPNLNPPEGDGGVTFAVDQKQNLSGGTLITNLASIVFDSNPAILTPVWTNRIAMPSTLSLDRIGLTMAQVTWADGILEQANSLETNDWINAPVQISPWTFPTDEPQKFFRVRDD